ncbi:succinate dehydrogenase assembly factor 4, mitochondrial-like [Athalia rosae]|uniref:succinate dehydrogenase assembly factor 4, mitochondrial-like n=1 Tax=Athalia rosae TaxID=37344 RepID=UPI00062611BF|nr:succinate dehydrogenase assembly factor 4, mitochondrial-like [Athalia rosae]
MFLARLNLVKAAIHQQIRNFGKGTLRMAVANPSGDSNKISSQEPSKRMEQFRMKLKLDPVPRVSPGMRFIDLMLVKTNPSTGELISDAEKDPTKWGDWQNGGRVSDF